MAGVTLKNISKVYPSRDKHRGEGVRAVDNFNMEIGDNEFIVFVGPSGCGKSTTLRMIAGLEEISSGELYIDGQYMNDTAPKDRDISMVFQNYALYPHMTAYKNIAFGLTLRKVAVPVYRDCEEVREKLVEIASHEADIRTIWSRVSAGEKRIPTLEKKLKDYQNYRGHLSEDLDAWNAHRVKTAAMQKQIVRLTTLIGNLDREIEETENALSAAQDTLSNAKTQMASHEAAIRAIREGIRSYQKMGIDRRALAKHEKSARYYRSVAKKDERRRVKTENALATKEKRCREINAALAEGKEGEGGIRLQLELESLEAEIVFLREELEILAARRITIENNQREVADKIAFYEKNEQPMFTRRHYTKSEIDRRVRTAADILDIGMLLNRKPREMSGGQRQRIALGRAIVREPKVFLLDEPLSNLDAKLRATMRGEISKLHEKLKTTFIYVTHDQIEAMTMGTRIVVMKNGVIQQIDTPTNLFDYPENTFVAGFIGTPQMNLFPVKMTVSGQKVAVVFTDRTEMTFAREEVRNILPAYCDGAPHDCVLGVRGENLSIGEKGISATLELVEILGNETHLHLKTPCVAEDKEVIVRIDDRVNYRDGDVLHLSVNASKIHLFDAETGKTILARN